MSMNLIHENRSTDLGLRAKQDWAAICATSDQGFVFIDEDIVDSIAMLLDGQPLTNGERVTTYYSEDGDFPAMVCSFGPAMLPIQVQDQVRDRLARGEAGPRAVRLFNEIIKRGLQISLSGKEHCPAHIKGVNWPGDDVSINLANGNMHEMLEALGIPARRISDSSGIGEIEFDRLVERVNESVRANRAPAGYPLERLAAFVSCGRRQGATHVHWA